MFLFLPVWFYVASAVLSLLQSRAQARAQKLQGRIAGLQGLTALEGAKFEAEFGRKRGAQEAEFIRDESRRGAGEAVTGIAVSGVELEGSPLLALADQIKDDEIAAGRAIINGEIAGFSAESRGRAAAASGAAENARLRTQAGLTQTAGWLNAMSIAVKGFSRQQQQTG